MTITNIVQGADIIDYQAPRFVSGSSKKIPQPSEFDDVFAGQDRRHQRWLGGRVDFIQVPLNRRLGHQFLDARLSVPSINKYGLVPSVRRWLFSEGHLRRTAGAAKST